MYAGHVSSIINLVDVVIVFVVSSGCLAVSTWHFVPRVKGSIPARGPKINISAHNNVGE